MKPSYFFHRLKRAVFRLNDRRIERIIREQSRARKNFFFVQVGSNDGVSGDPLRTFILEYGWHGLLIEPIPYLFEKLKASYAGRPGLTFEQVAVDRAPGERPLYYIRARGGGKMAWYEKLGSFSREHLEKHRAKIPNFSERLTSEPVRCDTLASLFARHTIRAVDLLHIDAEGYDYEIIKTISFDRVQPAMILYENKHLSAADKVACRRLLKRHGYRLLKGRDTFAYL